MKYAIVIPDGAADEPQATLGGKTPLQAARTPEMDRIAREGLLGRSRNVPARFVPASDVATLSLFGYDPVQYYTGRAPLEAAAMGHALGSDDWAIRCNLMTIRDGLLSDFTAGHITSEEGRALMEAIQSAVGRPNVEFYPGVSYRNLMIYRGQPGEAPFADDTLTTPPHDQPDQPAANFLPRGTGAELLRELMEAGTAVVSEHPVNQARRAAGKSPANAVWLWGQGQVPRLPRFAEVRGLKGAIISAVDLVRGVGVLAGWDRVDSPGATGYLDTDYAAKGRTGIDALRDHDLVCVHVEAPDEASHEGRADAKVEALEQIDRHIVGPLRRALEGYGEWRLLVSPDHATLLRTRAHDRGWVCWAMAGMGLTGSGSGQPYDEIALPRRPPARPRPRTDGIGSCVDGVWSYIDSEEEWQGETCPTTRGFATMGKGDKRTRRGKIFKGSFGKRRPKNKKADDVGQQAEGTGVHHRDKFVLLAQCRSSGLDRPAQRHHRVGLRMAGLAAMSGLDPRYDVESAVTQLSHGAEPLPCLSWSRNSAARASPIPTRSSPRRAARSRRISVGTRSWWSSRRGGIRRMS